jgi:hypothetical protein
METFSKYVGIQGVIAVLLVLAVIGLSIFGVPVPQVLGDLAIAAGAFYFGSKGGTVGSSAVEAAIWQSPKVRSLKQDHEQLASYALATVDLVKASGQSIDTDKAEAIAKEWFE